MRLIDADRLIKLLDDIAQETGRQRDAMISIDAVVDMIIDESPTEEETTRPVYNGRYWECEQCKERYKDILAVKEYKHCPGCGRRIEWQG